MITDRTVWEMDHLPRELLHRDHELSHLRRRLPPDGSGDILLHGPSGVGKTALARFVLEDLARETGVPTAHVHAMGLTTGDVLRDVLEQIGGDCHRTLPRLDVVARLRERVGPSDPAVAVLDEADDLGGQGTLALLDDVDGLHWVVIVHDRDEWLVHLEDSSARRRLGGGDAAVALDRYGTAELADILQRRADHGLRSGAVEREQLERIADDCAGVARNAIQVLRSAAVVAAERQHDHIRDGDMAAGHDRAERRILEAAIESVTFHHQVLYEIVRQSGGVDKTEIHDHYEAVAEEIYEGKPVEPICDRERRRKLSKLEDYGLIDETAPNRHGSYVPVDERVSAPADLPHSVVGGQ
jgi:Cdc6-like AAA superfamily ATPase